MTNRKKDETGRVLYLEFCEQPFNVVSDYAAFVYCWNVAESSIKSMLNRVKIGQIILDFVSIGPLRENPASCISTDTRHHLIGGQPLWEQLSPFPFSILAARI